MLRVLCDMKKAAFSLLLLLFLAPAPGKAGAEYDYFCRRAGYSPDSGRHHVLHE
jgi:hypothetical protein